MRGYIRAGGSYCSCRWPVQSGRHDTLNIITIMLCEVSPLPAPVMSAPGCPDHHYNTEKRRRESQDKRGCLCKGNEYNWLLCYALCLAYREMKLPLQKYYKRPVCWSDLKDWCVVIFHHLHYLLWSCRTEHVWFDIRFLDKPRLFVCLWFARLSHPQLR